MIKPQVFNRLTARLLAKVFNGQTKQATYTQITGTRTYDPTTDSFSGGTQVDIVLKWSLWYKPRIREEDPSKSATGSYREAEVEKEAFTVLVARDHLKNGAAQVEPMLDDTLVREDSSKWAVVDIEAPPGEPFWKLKVVANA